ncbi:hypothetical protein chiPu_0025607, partial [Chiloscyllium punctatum]|nr:hypothetical protein [Chiloscyllium punctatum]
MSVRFTVTPTRAEDVLALEGGWEPKDGAPDSGDRENDAAAGATPQTAPESGTGQ